MEPRLYCKYSDVSSEYEIQWIEMNWTECVSWRTGMISVCFSSCVFCSVSKCCTLVYMWRSRNVKRSNLFEFEFHSQFWHCWWGIRKIIQPVKSDEVLAWLSVCSEVQMMCIWSSWCHCHPIISCSSKIQNGSTFLVPAPGCPGRRGR